MENDVELLNNMLLQSLKHEIESIGDGAIYIPNISIRYDIKIDSKVIVNIESVESLSEYKIFAEYIAKEIGERIREDMENSIKENYYKILNDQQHILPNLRIVKEIESVIIDKKDITIGSIKGTLYVPKEYYKPLPIIFAKAIKSFADNILPTIRNAIKKLSNS